MKINALRSFTTGLFLFGISLQAQPGFFPLPKNEAAGSYFALKPEGDARGLLLLIPAPGQAPESLLQDSAWQVAAEQNGLVLVAFPHPDSLLITPATQRLFTAILRDACSRFELGSDRIALGGLGEGGILALQFAQECWSAPMLYPYRPRGLFCLDTPVDLAAWWRQAEADLKRNFSAEAVAKARWIMQSLQKEIGGAPDTLQTAYYRRSPFSTDRQDQGKERLLLRTGLRLYYWENIQDQLAAGRSWTELSMAPAAALIERLNRLGHANAAFMLCRRPDPAGLLHWAAASLDAPAERE